MSRRALAEAPVRPSGLGPLPLGARPMLAEAASEPPSGAEWAFEYKWDGLRAIVVVDHGKIKVTSRNGNDLTASLPELEAMSASLGRRSAVIDGEIVAFDERERPSYVRLQRRIHLGSPDQVARRAAQLPVHFLAFDLLGLDGHSLLELPYERRRALLETLQLDGPGFRTPSAYFDVDGATLLRQAAESGLEGIVAKRRSSPYAPGKRNGDWLKIKHFRTQEVVVGGWTEGRGARARGLGSLLLGVPGSSGLDFVGKVGTGFSDAERADLLDRLAPLERPQSPFAAPGADAFRAHYVEPVVVGEVRFSDWTSDGRLRQPSWRGARPDRAASEVVRES